jgi:hypothetical protein
MKIRSSRLAQRCNHETERSGTRIRGSIRDVRTTRLAQTGLGANRPGLHGTRQPHDPIRQPGPINGRENV